MRPELSVWCRLAPAPRKHSTTSLGPFYAVLDIWVLLKVVDPFWMGFKWTPTNINHFRGAIQDKCGTDFSYNKASRNSEFWQG